MASYPVPAGAKRPGPGGAQVAKNVTAATVINTGAGTVFRIYVNTAPSAAGGVYDTGTDTAGAVDAVTMTKVGSGYQSAPTVTFSAPASGTTATGTAVLSQGSVTGITITNAGSGYTSAPTITIGASPTGNDATATAVIGGPSAATQICTIPTSGGKQILEIIAPYHHGLLVDPGTAGVVSVSYE